MRLSYLPTTSFESYYNLSKNLPTSYDKAGMR